MFLSKLNSRMMRWASHEVCIGAKISKIKILVGELEGNRLPEEPIRKWEDNY
jgi:hypothetical protein